MYEGFINSLKKDRSIIDVIEACKLFLRSARVKLDPVKTIEFIEKMMIEWLRRRA